MSSETPGPRLVRDPYVNNNNVGARGGGAGGASDMDAEDVSYLNEQQCIQVMKLLRQQREIGELCDMLLVLPGGEESLWSHQCVLAANSPFFHAIIQQADRSQVPLKYNVPAVAGGTKAFKSLLTYMYSGEMIVSMETADDILSMCSVFGVEDVKQCCNMHLERNIDLSNWARVSHLAAKHRLGGISAKVEKFVTENIALVAQSNECAELGLESLTRIISLCNPDMDSETELCILVVVLKWLRHESQRLANCTDLLGHIRALVLGRRGLERVLEYEGLCGHSVLENPNVRKFLDNAKSCLDEKEKQDEEEIKKRVEMEDAKRNEALELKLENTQVETRGNTSVNEAHAVLSMGVAFGKLATDQPDREKVTKLESFKPERSHKREVLPALAVSDISDDEHYVAPGGDGEENKEAMSTNQEQVDMKTAFISSEHQSTVCSPQHGNRSDNQAENVPDNGAEKLADDGAGSDTEEEKEFAECVQTVDVGEDTEDLPLRLKPESAADNTEAEDVGEFAVKRRRRKSVRPTRIQGVRFKSEDVSDVDEMEEEHLDLVRHVERPLVKRKRGRPRKTTTAVPKKKGRPPKKQIAKPVKKRTKTISIQTLTEEDLAAEIAEMEMAVKMENLDYNDDTEVEDNLMDDKPYTSRRKKTGGKGRARRSKVDKSALIAKPKRRRQKPATTEEEMLKCPKCPRMFGTASALNHHIKGHGSEIPFLCEICGFSTRHYASMNLHKRRHTGRTYKCTHPGCSAEFIRKTRYNDHLNTHDGIKNYVCSVCGKAFGCRKHMQRHEKIHTDVKPIHCKECEYTTTRNDKLKEHIRKHHASTAIQLGFLSPDHIEKQEDKPPVSHKAKPSADGTPRPPRKHKPRPPKKAAQPMSELDKALSSIDPDPMNLQPPGSATTVAPSSEPAPYYLMPIPSHFGNPSTINEEMLHYFATMATNNSNNGQNVPNHVPIQTVAGTSAPAHLPPAANHSLSSPQLTPPTPHSSNQSAPGGGAEGDGQDANLWVYHIAPNTQY